MLSLFSTINLVYVLEINIFGRDGIIQIWIISSKDINIQCLCKIYCRELGQYLMQFDALEKKCNVTTNYSFKNCNKWTPYTKTTEDKKFTFWINAHTPIEKQSNQDWNTSIHLKSNGQHIKAPLIFWFLIMIFYLCFYPQLWVKWVCIDIGNSSGHIRQTYSWFPKYLWMFDSEWKTYEIDILDNLFN